MPNVPNRVAERIIAGLKKYPKIVVAARDRDINEADTVVIVTDFLSEVLGFDKYSGEITTEFSIRGTYCDLAVKVDGKVLYLLEVKAIGLALKEGHLRQAVHYAADHGVDWVVLTNGATWNIYKVRFEKPIAHELVFSLDIASAQPRDGDTIERLFLLSKEGLAKSAIDAFREQKQACNPLLVGAVLMSEPIVTVLRRELRRISPNARIDDEEVLNVMRNEVLKREIVEGDEARTASSQVKRAAGKALRQRSKITPDEAAALVATPPSEVALPTSD
jgi:hypothetical protein